MRALVLRAANLGDASVCSCYKYRREITFKGPVEPRKTFNIQHVDLVDEEHARHDRGPALLAPFGDLRVNLFPHFWLDLARIAGEQGQEALGPRVDDVDLVQRYGMYYFFALLELACAEHRRGPNGLEIQKETTHDVVRWTRVPSTK